MKTNLVLQVHTKIHKNCIIFAWVSVNGHTPICTASEKFAETNTMTPHRKNTKERKKFPRAEVNLRSGWFHLFSWGPRAGCQLSDIKGPTCGDNCSSFPNTSPHSPSPFIVRLSPFYIQSSWPFPLYSYAVFVQNNLIAKVQSLYEFAKSIGHLFLFHKEKLLSKSQCEKLRNPCIS